ncbi:MAG: manganese efflux pump [Desulfobacterales bacterium]|nr:manganese efflux pump [Desulfobacterales bacterium]
MGFFHDIAIAAGLAMDAFAVSIAVGATLGRVNFRQMFRLSWHFGLFQAMMPVIGWAAGLTVRGYVEWCAHWIAFGLLLFVAVNMIREAFGAHGAQAKKRDPTRGASLVLLSTATSIDALAVGVSFSVLQASIWVPVLIIGVTAGLFTITGLMIGGKIRTIKWLGSFAEILGGIVLMGIGLNILRERGVFDFLTS